MRRPTVPAAIWKIASRNASSICLPTAPQRRQCAPTSCGCGLPRWLYVLLCALRRLALQHTQFAKATCGMIRLKLLKVGALVRTSVRRIKFAMASGYPYPRDFAHAHAELINAAAP